MTRLFSYCLPFDDGAAPNPFWGLCTLAICKPAIRRAAHVGDWVLGTGSVNSPIGNISESVVYAMRVTQKLTMADYDAFTRKRLKFKIPAPRSKDPRRIVGDSIYDFDLPAVPQRSGSVHEEANRDTDLEGEFVLLSNHFFYFGDQPVVLPQSLLPVVKHGQGHRSNSNAPYLEEFVRWIEGLGVAPRSLSGQPQWWRHHPPATLVGACAAGRREEAESDVESD